MKPKRMMLCPVCAKDLTAAFSVRRIAPAAASKKAECSVCFRPQYCDEYMLTDKVKKG